MEGWRRTDGGSLGGETRALVEGVAVVLLEKIEASFFCFAVLMDSGVEEDLEVLEGRVLGDEGALALDLSLEGMGMGREVEDEDEIVPGGWPGKG